MDLRHQSSAMCIIKLRGEDTPPWSATKVGNTIVGVDTPLDFVLNLLLLLSLLIALLLLASPFVRKIAKLLF